MLQKLENQLSKFYKITVDETEETIAYLDAFNIGDSSWKLTENDNGYTLYKECDDGYYPLLEDSPLKKCVAKIHYTRAWNAPTMSEQEDVKSMSAQGQAVQPVAEE